MFPLSYGDPWSEAQPQGPGAKSETNGGPNSFRGCFTIRQLIDSDSPRFRGRADMKRGRGSYDDAERQYLAVLQCDPENEQARTGPSRTKQAEAISGGH